MTGVNTSGALYLLAQGVPPYTVVGADGTVGLGVLVAAEEGVDPGAADGGGQVKEDVGLLAVEPTLGVLVPVADDGDAGIGD